MVFSPLPAQLVVKPGFARERFESTGVVLVPGLLQHDEIEKIKKTFTEHVEHYTDLNFDDHIEKDDILSRYPRFVHPHRHPETAPGEIARRMIIDKRILQIVKELFDGGEAYGAQSMFYFKPPTARGQAMHQDNRSLQAHPETCLACWIAIDDADGENGGLLVIPGTHRSEILCHDEDAPADTFDRRQIKLPPGLTPIQTELRAGDALFFNGSLVHGSRGNTTTDRFRRALIFHYVPQTATQIKPFYHPLMTPDGKEVTIEESPEGGPCGGP
ncbi:phytanoyl-CoA dioxygenase family protein [Kockovaella imperatae]|uniref:Phytanoyl-CoA dioxygenase family protein n=1 Tax=Kockovaella imperatae TaxID=4999 RepID=A0A1Y1UP31_9TREE|nr:phytanoyl-CoA dioxygenase family protein [Kockovaella imperatae]ORX39226.1 phytanoyl-CoA dioxygenase family protein [Kockovaella imperatae]